MMRSRFVLVACVLLLGAGALAVKLFHGHGPTTAAIPVVDKGAVPPEPPRTSTGDWIGFHGGGPLLGEAAAIGGPPMKVRWTVHADDPVPATQPATAPATAPARRLPGHFEGSAAIVGPVAYVADTGGTLRAIDLQSGKTLWGYQVEAGFETTPLVLEGRVFLGDLDGIFHAVDARNGQKLWAFDSGGSIHSSANYLGEKRDRIVFGTDGADIFCLNAVTGEKLWEQKAGDRINGAPAVARGAALVSGCDAQLRALQAADGRELYTTDLGALCPGSATVAGDRIVMGTDQGRVLCISADTHQQLWLYDAVGEHAMVYSSPATSAGVVVFGARDRHVYAVELATGKELWKFPTRGDVDSSPAISAGRVYVGSKDKKLYVIDLKSGKELWSFTAGRGITAAPAIGGGVVVIGDSGGNLYCLEPK
ncbi:MAG: Pyrrolo-quinoline quinone repeat-containing protein [Phycisphaerales bacterium]|nr:Pyrrolo-quinoline quinone repeat-containing protein [Phycisphaerales bacterium]